MSTLRPLNLYVLLQVRDNHLIPAYDKILSDKKYRVKTREWEIKTIRSVVEKLQQAGAEINDLDGFFYSYAIPQIGKEFDLLRFSADSVFSLELKSVNVGAVEIREQLLRNRYYLRHLNRKLYLVTYVMSNGCFYFLNEQDELEEIGTAQVLAALRQTALFENTDLDKYFKASEFLISPINDPDKFLNHQYFLTQHQEHIATEILPLLKRGDHAQFISITGEAGTGKTLLLYDLARRACENGRVLVIHCTKIGDEQETISDRIDQFDMIEAKKLSDHFDFSPYRYLFIDETHHLPKDRFAQIAEAVKRQKMICVISSDPGQIFSRTEKENQIAHTVEGLTANNHYELTNKIRTNPQIAAYIDAMRDLNLPLAMTSFENVKLLCAATPKAAMDIISYYTHRGYTYINYARENEDGKPEGPGEIGQEYQNVLISLDRSFSYDKNGILCAGKNGANEYYYDQLFQLAITRVKDQLAILVMDNPDVFKKLMKIYEGR